MQVVRVNSFGPSVAEFLLDGASGKGEPAAVEVRAELVDARHPHHDGGTIGHGAKTILTFAQHPFCPSLFGDVEQGSYNGNELLLRVVLRLSRFQDDAFFAVGPHDAMFGTVELMSVRGLLHFGDVILVVSRMDETGWLEEPTAEPDRGCDTFRRTNRSYSLEMSHTQLPH